MHSSFNVYICHGIYLSFLQINAIDLKDRFPIHRAILAKIKVFLHLFTNVEEPPLFLLWASLRALLQNQRKEKGFSAGCSGNKKTGVLLGKIMNKFNSLKIIRIMLGRCSLMRLTLGHFSSSVLQPWLIFRAGCCWVDCRGCACGQVQAGTTSWVCWGWMKCRRVWPTREYTPAWFGCSGGGTIACLWHQTCCRPPGALQPASTFTLLQQQVSMTTQWLMPFVSLFTPTSL